MNEQFLITVALLLLAAVAVAAFAGNAFAAEPAQADGAAVTGQAVYRERISLPPTALFEATLEDVSRAGAEAEILGSVRIASPAAPPIPFTITYDPARIDERFTYAVRARITVDGKLMFTTDQVYPVLTRGAGDTVELMLRHVAGRAGAATSPVGPLPAGFAGELPCADCAGVLYELDLVSPDAYFLRLTYRGRGNDAVSDRIGAWSYAQELQQVVLWDDVGPSHRFQVVDPRTIRLLDRAGHAIDSKLNYNLGRTASPLGLEPRLALRGLYTIEDGTAYLVECTTGLRWPVMTGGDADALRRAYDRADRKPGDQLLVECDGHVERRNLTGVEPQNEPQYVVVIEDFHGAWPRETCGARLVAADLEGTRWALTRLGGAPAVVADDRQEPYLMLQSADRRVIGSGGCNRLTGRYDLEDNALGFDRLALTFKTCTDGMEQERTLIAVLEQVRRYRLTSQHLDLLAGDGTVLARFEARNLD